MSSLRYLSNPINDVFQANNQETIISNRFHYQSPYRSRFQYPPLISNLTNPNISPQLKSLINSSPTLKALSATFLPVIPSNEPPIEKEEDKKGLEPIMESKKPFLPKLKPINKKKGVNQQNLKKNTNIRFSNETTNVNQSNRPHKTQSTTTLPAIKPRASLKDKSSPRTQASTISSNVNEKQKRTQKYVDEYEHNRSTSSQNRDLESEFSERISSSKASCRSNNSKEMDLRFGSLLSEEGNYAMLKTYEDMIYQELLTLYPQLVKNQMQMYRTATQDFQMLPSRF